MHIGFDPVSHSAREHQKVALEDSTVFLEDIAHFDIYKIPLMVVGSIRSEYNITGHFLMSTSKHRYTTFT